MLLTFLFWASLLLATLQNEAMDIVSTKFAVAYSGLRVAATRNRRDLPAGLRRKFVNLDVTYAVVRHVTTCSASALLDELRAACSTPNNSPGAALLKEGPLMPSSSYHRRRLALHCWVLLRRLFLNHQ